MQFYTFDQMTRPGDDTKKIPLEKVFEKDDRPRISQSDREGLVWASKIDGEAKKAIIARLPADWVEQVKRAMVEAEEYSRGRRESVLMEIIWEQAVRGKMFEFLVEAEFSVEQTKLETELTALAKHRKDFGFFWIEGALRNSDLVSVKVSNDRVVLQSVIEVTTGKLGPRKLAQLLPSGNEATFRRIFEEIKKSELNFRKRLPALFSVREKIEVAEDFFQTVVFPSDSNLDDKAGLIDARSFRELRIARKNLNDF